MNPLSPPEVDGRWKLLRAELNGELAPELVTSSTEMVLSNGTYEVLFAGEATDRGRFELEGSENLMRIKFWSVEGLNAGKTIPGIYQRVGNRLRVCYGLDGVTPSGFSEATEHRYLTTYAKK